MKETTIMTLRDTVRERSGKGSANSMNDLAYDLDTGEFVPVRQNAVVPASYAIVTEMTSGGFASMTYETESELKKLGMVVRNQGGQGRGRSNKDLVFDTVTGEFVTKECDESVPTTGEIVTVMTEEGFAGNEDSQSDLYSRSSGLIENQALQKKKVLIVGLGSFGSSIAVELAKAAVGYFSIVDFDTLEMHNIVRHACFLKDVGRLKTDAVEELILGKNPIATVKKLPIDINKEEAVIEQEVLDADLVLVGTDNNKSRFLMSRLISEHKKVGVFGRANTRAEGGDVFVERPGGPCYGCLVGNRAFDVSAQEVSSRDAGIRSGAIAAYTSPEDAEAIIQVGLSCDISPIINLMVKLSLVELSKGTSAGLSALESELVYDYWMWANRRERRFRNWAAFPNARNLPTILRWYGARIPKDDGCPICGTKEPELD